MSDDKKQNVPNSVIHFETHSLRAVFARAEALIPEDAVSPVTRYVRLISETGGRPVMEVSHLSVTHRWEIPNMVQPSPVPYSYFIQRDAMRMLLVQTTSHAVWIEPLDDVSVHPDWLMIMHPAQRGADEMFYVQTVVPVVATWADLVKRLVPEDAP